MHEQSVTTRLLGAMTRVAEVTAIAAANMIGRGDEHAADQAAVSAMREAFNAIDFRGRVVIGEGERDEAPMLYIGEEVGTGNGPAIDIAIDPLEGTTLTAKAMANALSVLAIAPENGLLHAPDTYMDKIAIGAGYPPGLIDLDASAGENITEMAKAKGVANTDMTACVLDRPRHGSIIESLRSAGARVHLISDGDVAGVINTTNPDTGIDLYIGRGGAPEGVLAAAALKCIGGQMLARLHFRNDDERQRADRAGISDYDTIYNLDSLVSGDTVFCATGVTTGGLVDGVRYRGDRIETDSLVMNSADGTIGKIKSFHRKSC